MFLFEVDWILLIKGPKDLTRKCKKRKQKQNKTKQSKTKHVLVKQQDIKPTY